MKLVPSLLLALACLAAPAAAADRPGAPPRPAAAAETWSAAPGATLGAVLAAWSRKAGWTLVWDSPVDWRLRAPFAVSGDFREAVARLAESVAAVHPRLSITLHEGNRVLQVSDLPAVAR